MKADLIYADLAERLATMMETADPKAWAMPWHGDALMPRNADTRKPYHGGNVLVLLDAAVTHCYSGPWWATYRQWSALGRQVQRGETATHCVKWITAAPRDDGDDGDAPAAAGKRGSGRIFPRGFALFHHEQTAPAEGAEHVWEPPEPGPVPDRIAHAETWASTVGVDLRHTDPNAAYYRPGGDYVNVPPLETFDDAPAYYATVAHEYAHWTGAPSRLDRATLRDYSTDRAIRAREELTAELGAAFVCSALGITNAPREDHAQYLASWASLLRDDPRAVWTAASAADKAVTFLFDAAGIDRDAEGAALIPSTA